MDRYFNTEGCCRPGIHYMVRLDDRLDAIKRLYVDRGKYFVINRGRQYGKTTTLRALAEYLKDDYVVLPMDFQTLGSDCFVDGPTFVLSFIDYLEEIFSGREGLRDAVDAEAYRKLMGLRDQRRLGIDKLFRCLSGLCRTAERPMVLIIDEVDSASNNQVFIDFLAQLRRYYLDRDISPAFQSVILAGVYDIKNLKLKIRPDDEHQYNSPWNIAAEFHVEMDFSSAQIRDMLEEYEADHHTGMDTTAMSEEIYQYTSGYPYLVSAICKRLDEHLSEKEGYAAKGNIWSKEGIGEAVADILKTKLLLFDSMLRQLDLYPELKDVLEQILYEGQRISFSLGIKSISLGTMFGFLKEKDGQVVPANRIFEMYLLNRKEWRHTMGMEDFLSSKNERMDSQLLFAAQIDRMTAILRRTLLIDRSRRENDAEHSWHIAVMAMLFQEYAAEPVDIGRVVQMCVVHDLVEIIAGDTFAYDVEGNKGKEEREKAAADELFATLPREQGQMLRAFWEEFDAMETADAKYAACMDRLQPFLHNTLTDGHTWVESGTNRAMVEKRMAVVKNFMPKVYAWVSDNIDHGIQAGWLKS